ncbi:cell wall hydrolase [Neorhizobium galegae]|uniref:Cell wall hydrolyses involved in spore germination n=2 Tax=Neorhizobium galegae TaxID=399 RepID=A0A068SLN7_NEOGA|nr:cell wall hydrolase [Neorhizobium galegae]CDN46646.1 Cell wall hydrolyses involved in spore germination [Neorhizobium galegae bv. orientalis str. HAMBI 540]
MRSKSVLRRRSSSGLSGWTSPAVFGLACWLIFPSAPAHGDLADLLTGFDGAEQWRMVLTDSPAGSIHQASLAFPGVKNAVSGNAGLELPDGRKIALVDEKQSSDPRPDEDRVNRAAKKGRIVSVEPMQPPKAFSAGSVLQRSSALTSPIEEKDAMTAFLKAGKNDAPVELASFYFRKDEPRRAEDELMPMIASLINNPNADVLAAAYAPAEPDFAKQSPFDAILTEKKKPGRFIPPISADDHAWAATPLPPDSFSAKQQQCLSSGIYFESRGESARGQAAVAQVILNRVRNPAYPKTICDVVYQNEDWRNRCQFSFACDNIKDRIRSEYHWTMAREVAMAVTAGKIWLPEVGSATHYHAVYVHPDWARTMKKVGRIGLHVFYRTYGGGWS